MLIQGLSKSNQSQTKVKPKSIQSQSKVIQSLDPNSIQSWSKVFQSSLKVFQSSLPKPLPLALAAACILLLFLIKWNAWRESKSSLAILDFLFSSRTLTISLSQSSGDDDDEEDDLSGPLFSSLYRVTGFGMIVCICVPSDKLKMAGKSKSVSQVKYHHHHHLVLVVIRIDQFLAVFSKLDKRTSNVFRSWCKVDPKSSKLNPKSSRVIQILLESAKLNPKSAKLDIIVLFQSPIALFYIYIYIIFKSLPELIKSQSKILYEWWVSMILDLYGGFRIILEDSGWFLIMIQDDFGRFCLTLGLYGWF